MSFVIQHKISTHTVAPFLYSVTCYLITLLSLGYFIVFTSGIYAPISINSQQANSHFMVALIGNIALIMLFGLQHSVMARKRFKGWLLNYLPQSVERATYCLGSALALSAVCYFWMPMSGSVWSVSSGFTATTISAIGGVGWSLLLVATFQLDHFELFGLRQTFAPLVGQEMPVIRFKTPGLYKIVRHPIQLGLLIGIWAVPVSTINHQVLAIAMTMYVFIGLYFEEKDLVRTFGKTYREYKQRVAKVIPFVG